jgi:long-chain acyl-CoA synthetase
MKTYTSPGGVNVAPSVNAVQQLMVRADTQPEYPALMYRVGDEFVSVSTRDFYDTVVDLAAGLISAGISKGDRVALHSGTRI